MHWYELEVWKRTCFPDSELTYFLLIPPQTPVFCTWHLLYWIDSTFWIFLGLCVSNVFGCSLSVMNLNTPVCQSYSLKPFHVWRRYIWLWILSLFTFLWNQVVATCGVAESMRINQGDWLVPILALQVLCPGKALILDNLQGFVRNYPSFKT